MAKAFALQKQRWKAPPNAFLHLEAPFFSNALVNRTAGPAGKDKMPSLQG